MNLEQAIHQRWAATSALESLLPAENVKTGRSFGDPMPYATISRTKGRPGAHTNAGNAVDIVTLRMCIWHDNYDEALAIAEEIKAAFDRSSFELSAGGDLVQMRRTGESSLQHADGVWQLTVELLARIYLTWDV